MTTGRKKAKIILNVPSEIIRYVHTVWTENYRDLERLTVIDQSSRDVFDRFMCYEAME